MGKEYYIQEVKSKMLMHISEDIKNWLDVHDLEVNYEGELFYICNSIKYRYIGGAAELFDYVSKLVKLKLQPLRDRITILLSSDTINDKLGIIEMYQRLYKKEEEAIYASYGIIAKRNGNLKAEL